MSEERFDRLETMMTDLMRMVGATNAEVGKLTARVDAIEGHLVNLTEKVCVLEKRFDALDAKVEALDAKVEALDAKVDNNQREVMEALRIMDAKIGLLAERELHNKAEITALKRAR